MIDLNLVSKTIIYRVVSLVLGGIVVYALTHKWWTSLAFVAADTVVKTIWYYVYEKFWSWLSCEIQWRQRKKSIR